MVYMYHSFLIHSSADGHLDCFHVLAIINSQNLLLTMLFKIQPSISWSFPGFSSGKEPGCHAGDARYAGSILGWRRFPGGGLATHSGILSWIVPRDRRRSWRTTVHRVAKSWTQLKRLVCTHAAIPSCGACL